MKNNKILEQAQQSIERFNKVMALCDKLDNNDLSEFEQRRYVQELSKLQNQESMEINNDKQEAILKLEKNSELSEFQKRRIKQEIEKSNVLSITPQNTDNILAFPKRD